MNGGMQGFLMDQGIEGIGRFYSFYRAIVTNNEDPNNLNSLEVAIPDIQGGIIIWALPLCQHGGLKTGFKYLVPEIGDIVFVTFEYGNPSKPLWTYSGFGLGQMPDELKSKNVMGFITPNGNRILLDDSKGTLNIQVSGNVNIKSTKGIVSVNDGKNGEIIKINELTNKLNTLVKELESLKTKFNLHTHNGVTTGGGTTGVPVVPINDKFSSFNKNDYSDPKFKH